MEGKYFEVDANDQTIVEFPDKAEPCGIGPCVGVGIMNRKFKRGYLGHFLSSTTDPEILIDLALIEARKPNQLEVILVGNNPTLFQLEEDCTLEDDYFSTNEIHEYEELSALVTKEHEDWLKKMVYSKGIPRKNITLRISANPKITAYGLLVDTESGKITIKEEL